MEKQTTINGSATFTGKGLHTGQIVTMTISPGSENTGYVFRRIDLDGKQNAHLAREAENAHLAREAEIKADARKVSFTQRGTVLAEGDITISTIEHILSALRGLRVDNCLIEVNGPEVPILDGSAKLYVDKIKEMGIKELNAEREYLVIDHKSVYEEKEKGIKIIALPDEEFCAQVNIEFAGSRCLGNQFALIESLDEYEQVCACRTFVFLHEVKFLLQNNLIKGGDLDNAIVFVEQALTDDEKAELTQLLGRSVTIHASGVLNDHDLQYPNEAARHKLLDLVGDLSLVGKPIRGRVIATRSGHGSNTAFARQLLKEYNL